MKHPERVDDYLEHILEAIKRPTRYLQSLQRIEGFRSGELLQDVDARRRSDYFQLGVRTIAGNVVTLWRRPGTGTGCERFFEET